MSEIDIILLIQIFHSACLILVYLTLRDIQKDLLWIMRKIQKVSEGLGFNTRIKSSLFSRGFRKSSTGSSDENSES